jgi:FtsP/CotA-like multicopper oxidase with cupredoxin domain
MIDRNVKRDPRHWGIGQKLFLLTPLALAMSGAQAQALPGGTLDPTTIPKYVSDLVIPGVMKKSDALDKDYEIAVRQFRQQMLPTTGCDPAVQPPGSCTRRGSFRPTKIWGYGPSSDVPPRVAPVPAAESQFNHPSFTVEVERDQTVVVDWINDLVNQNSENYLRYDSIGLPIDQTLHWANPGADCLDGIPRTDCMGDSDQQYRGPVPMVTHVHGAHATSENDGYPEAWYLPAANNINCVDPAAARGNRNWVCEGTLANGFGAPPNVGGGKATFTYPNDQPSTTLWYHDHSLGVTRANVYGMGAGFWLIRAPGGGEDGLVRGTLPGPAPASGEDPNFVTADRAKVREIPLAIADKAFNSDGSLFFPANRAFFEGLGDGQTYDQNANEGLLIPFLPSANSDISPVWNPEVFFNTMVVNGNTWPKLDVEPERYRFRLLNASDSRFLNLAMFEVNPDGSLGQEIAFYMIGAEQSLLSKVTKVWTGCKTWLGQGQDSWPVVAGNCPTTDFGNWFADDPAEALLMGPAERADVIVDFTGIPAGTKIRMINTAPDAPFGGFPDVPADPGTTGQVMEFHVIADDPATVDSSTPPAQLRISLPDLADWNDTNVALTRDQALLEEESALICVTVDAVSGVVTWDPNSVPPTCDPVLGSFAFAPKAAVLGVDGRNGGLVQLWDDPISSTPTVGTQELWQLWNWSADAHPIHIHLVKFRVMSRRVIGGAFESAELTEQGWKDTVIAYPGEVTTVRAKFDIPGLYVWHCHILSHEDNEMMVPYCVNNADGSPGPGCAGL